MNLTHFILFVPLIYLGFYIIAWLYARKHFPIKGNPTNPPQSVTGKPLPPRNR